MSSRPLIKPISVVTSGDMSAQIISKPTITDNLSMVSYDCTYAGAPVGAVTIQVSNSYSQNVDGSVKNAGHWTTLTLSNLVPVSGAGGSFIDIDATAAYAIRLVYTPTSGSGTMNVILASKVM